jgi:hypothetical protein
MTIETGTDNGVFTDSPHPAPSALFAQKDNSCSNVLFSAAPRSPDVPFSCFPQIVQCS